MRNYIFLSRSKGHNRVIPLVREGNKKLRSDHSPKYLLCLDFPLDLPKAALGTYYFFILFIVKFEWYHMKMNEGDALFATTNLLPITGRLYAQST